MNTFELSDVDGDALTIISQDNSTWITCTSGAEEVTVGPFPGIWCRRCSPRGSRSSGAPSHRS